MKAVALAVGLVLAGPAWGQYFFTGNTLHDSCANNRTQAQAYIIGMLDGLSFIRQTSDISPPNQFCLPDSVMSGQLTDIVCAHLKEYPENRHYQASFHVGFALNTSFPCS